MTRPRLYQDTWLLGSSLMAARRVISASLGLPSSRCTRPRLCKQSSERPVLGHVISIGQCETNIYLETLQVSGVDGERVLVTRLGSVPLLPGLVNGPLQIQDQVGEREHLDRENQVKYIIIHDLHHKPVWPHLHTTLQPQSDPVSSRAPL